MTTDLTYQKSHDFWGQRVGHENWSQERYYRFEDDRVRNYIRSRQLRSTLSPNSPQMYPAAVGSPEAQRFTAQQPGGQSRHAGDPSTPKFVTAAAASMSQRQDPNYHLNESYHAQVPYRFPQHEAFFKGRALTPEPFSYKKHAKSPVLSKQQLLQQMQEKRNEAETLSTFQTTNNYFMDQALKFKQQQEREKQQTLANSGIAAQNYRSKSVGRGGQLLGQHRHTHNVFRAPQGTQHPYMKKHSHPHVSRRGHGDQNPQVMQYQLVDQYMNRAGGGLQSELNPPHLKLNTTDQPRTYISPLLNKGLITPHEERLLNMKELSLQSKLQEQQRENRRLKKQVLQMELGKEQEMRAKAESQLRGYLSTQQ